MIITTHTEEGVPNVYQFFYYYIIILYYFFFYYLMCTVDDGMYEKNMHHCIQNKDGKGAGELFPRVLLEYLMET